MVLTDCRAAPYATIDPTFSGDGGARDAGALRETISQHAIVTAASARTVSVRRRSLRERMCRSAAWRSPDTTDVWRRCTDRTLLVQVRANIRELGGKWKDGKR